MAKLRSDQVASLVTSSAQVSDPPALQSEGYRLQTEPGGRPGHSGALRSAARAGSENAPQRAETTRLLSLDAYRGFIMLAMASGGFAFSRVAKELQTAEGYDPTTLASRVWAILAYQFDHVPWTGCGFWDLIQPSFMFMVGVAMPYSYAKRRASGESSLRMFGHVVYRSIVLILLGIFLSSNWSKQTNFTFVNVLTQIGLGYTILYLLWGKTVRTQLAVAAAVLVGYWLAFTLYPAPGTDFDWAAVGAQEGFEPFTGLAGHWNKNANFASAVDLWFLNLFPREKPFEFNEGGYQTLNFVPSLVTMIFGLVAGEWLRRDTSHTVKFAGLILGGAVCLSAGLLVDHTIWPESLAALVPWFDPTWSLCPIVKRSWTPSWAIFSTGWTLWMLGGFYLVIDFAGLRRWSFPLVVVGVNSIAMYCMAQLLKPWTRETLKIHFGKPIESLFAWRGWSVPDVYLPVVQATAVLLVLWLFCFWMYRQKIFVRI